jgi:hypothetical protein
VAQIRCDCSNYARKFVNWYVFSLLLCTPYSSFFATAMMGSTYSKVKDDLDREWKFYRYCLITEFINAPASPPQLIPIFVPLKKFLTDLQTPQNNELKPSSEKQKISIGAMNVSKQK